MLAVGQMRLIVMCCLCHTARIWSHTATKSMPDSNMMLCCTAPATWAGLMRGSQVLTGLLLSAMLLGQVSCTEVMFVCLLHCLADCRACKVTKACCHVYLCSQGSQQRIEVCCAVPVTHAIWASPEAVHERYETLERRVVLVTCPP